MKFKNKQKLFMMIEIAVFSGRGRVLTRNVYEESLWVDETILYLIGVTRLYGHIKMYQFIHLRFVSSTICVLWIH